MERRETIQCRTDETGQRKCVRFVKLLKHVPGRPPEIIKTEEQEIEMDQPQLAFPEFSGFFDDSDFLPSPEIPLIQTFLRPFAYSVFEEGSPADVFEPSSALGFRRRQKPPQEPEIDPSSSARVQRSCISTIYIDPTERLVRI